jgi:hypothetical protein
MSDEAMNSHQKKLWQACHARDEELIKSLIHSGHHARFADSSGITPLMIALVSRVGFECLSLLAGVSDLSAQDEQQDSAPHRAARRAKAPLLDWLRAYPSIALLGSALGRKPCREAAFARWPEGLGALLRAENALAGPSSAEESAKECLVSLVMAGVSVGDSKEMEALRLVPPGSHARLAQMIGAMWGGAAGEARQRERMEREKVGFNQALMVLAPRVGVRAWETVLSSVAPSRLDRKVEHALHVARAFAAHQEAAFLQESIAWPQEQDGQPHDEGAHRL